tara:strand:+ start:8908 stop:9618 length:711 start_codon:yes stop_codon:yes gene_type:complete
LFLRFSRQSKEDAQLRLFLKNLFGFEVKNLSLYRLALTHSSVIQKRNDLNQSNERLEFLGDAILDAIIADYLYTEFPDLSEGELTKEKAKVVNRRTLNRLAGKIGLDKYLEYSINFNTEDTSLLGNALEALIGALFLDLGYIKTERATLKMFAYINLSLVLEEQKDYKSLLHEWSQRTKKEVKFRTVNEFNLDGRNEYEVEVQISGEICATATDYSKKKAQKLAAKQAFEYLKIET